MSQTYTLFFSLDIFKPEVRPVVKHYLSGEISASYAAAVLGWKRETWERHMAAVFSLAVNPEISQAWIVATPMEATPA